VVYFIPKCIRNGEGGNEITNQMCSAKSHFHINIAEWIGEADSIKPLNRNRKTLEKEKCIS